MRPYNVIFGLGFVTACSVAQAQIISSPSTGGVPTGFFINSSSVAVGNPGNGLNGGWQTGNTFDADISFGSFTNVGGINYEIGLGPATEYSTTMTIKNTSGVTWSSYDLWVGAGTWGNPTYVSNFVFGTGFNPTISGTGTGGAVNTSMDNNWVSFTGLNVPDSATITIKANYGITFGLGSWHLSHRYQAVPEPTSLTLLVLGIASLVRRKRQG